MVYTTKDRRRKVEDDNVSVGVLVVDEPAKRFIMVKNKGGPKEISPGNSFNKPPGWGLPNGRKKPSDADISATGYREVKEETGGLHVYVEQTPVLERQEKNHKRVFVVGYPVAGKIGVPEDENVIEARWFPFSVLWTEDPNLPIYPVHRKAARGLLERLGY